MNPNDILSQFNNVYVHETPDTFLDKVQATNAYKKSTEKVQTVVDGNVDKIEKSINFIESKKDDNSFDIDEYVSSNTELKSTVLKNIVLELVGL
jgi:hypothetical protein